MNLSEFYFAANRDEPEPTAGWDMYRQWKEHPYASRVACYSLDCLWRAVGSPEGHDPESWFQHARMLAAGFSDYSHSIGRTYGLDADDEQPPVLFTVEGEAMAVSGWRIGDTAATHLFALCYALHLDNRVLLIEKNRQRRR